MPITKTSFPSENKTHREVKNPTVSVRYLADYMAASEQAKRTIIRGCKYQPIARIVQHDEAKTEVARYLRHGHLLGHPGTMADKAEELRNRIADSDFDRLTFDWNADYLDRFIGVSADLELPSADVQRAQKLPPLMLHGVKVNIETAVKLHRVTKTNKIKVGAVMLRYAKGKALADAVGEWQSAFLFGYLAKHGPDAAEAPDYPLCLTLDAYRAELIAAPTDSIERFNNMSAACASIAERWPNILPPPNAKL